MKNSLIFVFLIAIFSLCTTFFLWEKKKSDFFSETAARSLKLQRYQLTQLQEVPELKSQRDVPISLSTQSTKRHVAF